MSRCFCVEVGQPLPGEAEPSGAPSCCGAFLEKLRGAGVEAPPSPPMRHTVLSCVGAFVSLSALGLGHRLVAAASDGTFEMIIPPFGAVALLIFGAHKAPLAQPKNVILGNVIGAVVGYAVWSGAAAIDDRRGLQDCGSLCEPTEYLWLTAAIAVSLTIVIQEKWNVAHPPGAAMALVYVTVPRLRHMGAAYILCPSLLGSLLFVCIGVLINNVSLNRAYPQSSWLGRSDGARGPPQGASRLAAYLPKFLGAGVKAPPPVPLKESAFSFCGSFVGMAALALLPRVLAPMFPMFPGKLVLGLEKLLIGPFGAMAVLVFSVPEAPVSQPKNVVVGNGIGALAGVLVVKAAALLPPAGGDLVWLEAASAVCLTIAGQEVCAAGHPPGAATALLFVLAKPLQALGFLYVLVPSAFGATLLVLVGLLANNLSSARAYPQRWR